MENLTDALHIAFGIMIFVLALSITISSFSQAREAAQEVIDYSDRQNNYTYIIQTNEKNRTVGIEMVIPTLYRAYKENYKVIFYNKNNPNTDPNVDDDKYELYKKADGTIINYVDLEEESKWEVREAWQVDPTKHLSDILASGLYNELKGKKFTEILGEYYLEDINGENDEVAEVNKNKKRIITYIVQ